MKYSDLPLKSGIPVLVEIPGRRLAKAKFTQVHSNK